MNQHELELFDLYGLWYEPFWYKPWFWIVIITVLTLFIVLLLYWFIQKRKKDKNFVKKPWQEALDHLNALYVQECKSITLRKEFYLNLTNILKRYLTRRYGIALESKTDEEVLIVLKKSEFPVERFEDLFAIFNGALYIKFADQDAALDQMQQDLDRTISVVKFTAVPPLLDTSDTL